MDTQPVEVVDQGDSQINVLYENAEYETGDRFIRRLVP